ncbi:Tat pathway signal protein [Streptomyces sp. SID12501]|uniref:Tat pathway signal protein n=1 Tax=Streptomyces sp. SID12501 TaxID=2706042 RepID=A0A6B3BXX8_9ACTN|nr:Tat pathway signal protein [Streptomyces sp. SID12501]NEC89291.1 Tat pathway signal protein [Streptomyces sp. SID12501]
MINGITLKSVQKKLAVAAAAAGLVMAFSGQAQAASYAQSTYDGCASTYGTFNYWQVGTAGGYALYDTNWDFTIWDNCADGKGAGLYTTYQKWENGAWNYHGYTKLGSDSNGANGTPGYASSNGYSLRDVKLYVCFVGDGSSCVSLF